MMNADPKRPPVEIPPHEPAPNQFGLRGMLLLMTALCLILAAVSWTGFNRPMHLIGAAIIAIFCALLIVVIEFIRYGFPELHSPSGRVRHRGGAFDPAQRSGTANPFPSGENPFRDEALPPEESDGEK